MAQDPNNMDKELTRKLIDDCLLTKGWTREQFAAAVGMQFPKMNREPKPLSVQTIYNAFTPKGWPLKIARVTKWCAVLGYPVEDLLAGRPYVDPNSQEALRRDFEKAMKRIETLEEEVKKLKEAAAQMTT